MKILFLLLFLVPFVVPAFAANIVIIEVESNPEGNDAGKEWARLFNSGKESVTLSGWGINSTHAETKSYNLSGNIGACTDKMIKFPGEFVDNENESLILYDDTGKVVDSTSKINDKANNSITWTTKTPKCEFSLDKSSEEDPAPTPVETTPKPVETTPKPVKTTPEIIEESEENNFLDFGVSIEKDEEFIEDLDPILPYLGIVAVVIFGIVIVIIMRNSRKEYDPSEVKDKEKDKEYDIIPMSEKFQDMQTNKNLNKEKIPSPEQFIENKIRLILNLQENKIGDFDKLEKIKNSLMADRAFTLKDNKYIESQNEEFKNATKKKSEDDKS
ncbi:MAG TPA: lamin tail domain-containing protein [Nitrosopumilaceae archaeon]|nr:lamin tail domain-containing protein [Nitrosopumilaceae archaeon]